MDAGCLLAAEGEQLTDENYRMFLSDGSPLGPVWLLDCGEPEAEGETCPRRRVVLMSAAPLGVLKLSTCKKAHRLLQFGLVLVDKD